MKIEKKPDAICVIKGSKEYQSIHGIVFMSQTERGVYLQANMKGLPITKRIECNQPIYAFHIHEGKSCTGTSENPFSNALGHYNPNNCPHPFHAGDLGNLFVNKDGSVYLSMINDRFNLNDVIGRVMIIHSGIDDFKTQPSGNSDGMMACGVIRSYQKKR